jgi:hypothetical protein
MKFLCIVYHSEKRLNAMSEAEQQALTDEALDYDETLRKTGHYVHSNALDLVDQAKTLRLKKGKVVVTDGPYVETKEQVGGYILIEAKDQKEAIVLASKIPPMRTGGIEVRPVLELKHSRGKSRK